jgi:hypothetical protein
MLESIYRYLYHADPTGGISLRSTGLLLGLALVASHLVALLRPAQVKSFLVKMPRNYPLGIAILFVCLIWSIMVIQHMHMGDFHGLRRWFLMIVPAGFVGVVLYVREFLSVRAIGCLMLLAAAPVLNAAFLQEPLSRLLLPLLAYGWIIAGMYLVGMPFLLRDWIQWAVSSDKRWNALVWGGIGYGAVMILCAVLFY